MLRPVLPAALDALLNMCTAFNASSEILGLVLENMTVVLSVSQSTYTILNLLTYFCSFIEVGRSKCTHIIRLIIPNQCLMVWLV